ncbi:unnamed protein product [Mucor hiemalis]
MSINLNLENTISFERPLTRIVKQSIKIQNTNSTPVAFKVKTTAPKLYCVRPNSDIIPPGKTADVQIMLQAFKEEPALDLKCKDKFLILSAVVNDENVHLQEFWAHTEANAKSSIHERKLRCVYIQPGANTATAPVASAPVATENIKKTDTTREITTASKDQEVAEKLKLMEEELNKYKKEVETLRESEPVVVEKVQIKTTGFPISVFILFALLAVAVAYFLKNGSSDIN